MTDTATHPHVVGHPPGFIRGCDPSEVPPDIAAIALHTATAAADALELPWGLVVGFFEPTTQQDMRAVGPVNGARHMNGFHQPSEPHKIWVRRDLGAWQTESTVAHEARHAWQTVHGWRAFCSRLQLEHDARAYDIKWMAREL